MEEKLDENYTGMLSAVFNKSWKQLITKQQLSNHLPPSCKSSMQGKQDMQSTCWRCKDEHISNVPLLTLTLWPARSYIHRLSADTGYCQEDLLEAMDDGKG